LGPGIAHAEQVDLVPVAQPPVDLVGPRPGSTHPERATPTLVDELQDPHRGGCFSLSFRSSCSSNAVCWASSLRPVLRSDATTEKYRNPRISTSSSMTKPSTGGYPTPSLEATRSR